MFLMYTQIQNPTSFRFFMLSLLDDAFGMEALRDNAIEGFRSGIIRQVVRKADRTPPGGYFTHTTFSFSIFEGGGEGILGLGALDSRP